MILCGDAALPLKHLWFLSFHMTQKNARSSNLSYKVKHLYLSTKLVRIAIKWALTYRRGLEGEAYQLFHFLEASQHKLQNKAGNMHQEGAKKEEASNIFLYFHRTCLGILRSMRVKLSQDSWLICTEIDSRYEERKP